MHQFGKKRDLKRVIGPAILIFLLFVLPVTTLFSYAAFDQAEFKVWFWVVILIFFVWYISIKHLHTLYSFPKIQIDQDFFILCECFSRRRVYNLENISGVKCFSKSIYFKHNGWFVVINLTSLTEEEQDKLFQLLKTG